MNNEKLKNNLSRLKALLESARKENDAGHTCDCGEWLDEAQDCVQVLYKDASDEGLLT